MTNNRIEVESLNLESVFGKRAPSTSSKIRDVIARFEDQQFKARHVAVAVFQEHPQLAKIYNPLDMTRMCQKAIKRMQVYDESVRKIGDGWWQNRCQQ